MAFQARVFDVEHMATLNNGVKLQKRQSLFSRANRRRSGAEEEGPLRQLDRLHVAVEAAVEVVAGDVEQWSQGEGAEEAAEGEEQLREGLQRGRSYDFPNRRLKGKRAGSRGGRRRISARCRNGRKR